jgi:cytochrome c-type biogenesis protein
MISDLVASADRLTAPGLLIVALMAGVVSAFSPCILPVVPAIIARIFGEREPSPARGFALSLLFVLGMASVYTGLGFVAGGIGSALKFNRGWYYLAALVSLVMGAKLVGWLEFELPAPIRLRRPEIGGLAGTLLLGIVYGLASSPCATPLLAVILTVSASQQSPVFGGALLFAYAFGHGSLLLVAGTATSFVKRALARRPEVIEASGKLGGALFLALGLYFLIVA